MPAEDLITWSSGNVFDDVGVNNPEEALLKARLVLSLRQTIEDRGLSQFAAADRIGMKQPDLSTLLRGKTAGISLEAILDLIKAIGNDIEIRVRAVKTDRAGRVVLRMA